VATTFGTQPVCNARGAVHALRSTQFFASEGRIKVRSGYYILNINTAALIKLTIGLAHWGDFGLPQDIESETTLGISEIILKATKFSLRQCTPNLKFFLYLSIN
jgi:hypothetical protein